MTLPHVVSASGARYSNGAGTFWNKGREATFELNGRTQTCRERREPWQEAADRGVDFRAVGQEPGWFLEIDNGEADPPRVRLRRARDRHAGTEPRSQASVHRL